MLCPASYFLFRSAASLSRSPPVTRLPFLSSATSVPSTSNSSWSEMSPGENAATPRMAAGKPGRPDSDGGDDPAQQDLVAAELGVHLDGGVPAVRDQHPGQRHAGLDDVRSEHAVRGNAAGHGAVAVVRSPQVDLALTGREGDDDPLAGSRVAVRVPIHGAPYGSGQCIECRR